MEILLFWLPGRVVGPEAGPGRKWQGLGPALSIASAATAVMSVTCVQPGDVVATGASVTSVQVSSTG